MVPRAQRRRRVLAALGTVVFLVACGTPDPSGPEPEVTPRRDCPRGILLGAGPETQRAVLDEVTTAYQAACRATNTIEYDTKPPADGITDFTNGLTHFAGTETPLTEQQSEEATRRCLGAPAWHLPMVVTPITVAFHLDGVDRLVLDAPTAARVFAGEIDRWNDPEIAALNPDVSLPATPLTVLHRADAAGTTQTFTQWLHTGDPEVWTTERVSQNWKGSGRGIDGEADLVTAVQNTPGAIAYIETSADGDQPTGAVIRTAGGDVEPTSEAVGTAITTARRLGGEHDLRLDLGPTVDEPEAYPLVQVTYEVVCSQGLGPEQTALVKDFFTFFTAESTQAHLAAAGYHRLPQPLAEEVSGAIAAIS